MVHSDLLLPAQHYLASAHESHMERHIIPTLKKDKLNLKRMYLVIFTLLWMVQQWEGREVAISNVGGLLREPDLLMRLWTLLTTKRSQEDSLPCLSCLVTKLGFPGLPTTTIGWLLLRQRLLLWPLDSSPQSVSTNMLHNRQSLRYTLYPLTMSCFIPWM